MIRRMASLRQEIHIDAPATQAWDALRDVGALHTRLVPGFVTQTTLEGQSRRVTFGNGMTVREDIVSVDDAVPAPSVVSFKAETAVTVPPATNFSPALPSATVRKSPTFTAV